MPNEGDSKRDSQGVTPDFNSGTSLPIQRLFAKLIRISFFLSSSNPDTTTITRTTTSHRLPPKVGQAACLSSPEEHRLAACATLRPPAAQFVQSWMFKVRNSKTAIQRPLTIHSSLKKCAPYSGRGRSGFSWSTFVSGVTSTPGDFISDPSNTIRIVWVRCRFAEG